MWEKIKEPFLYLVFGVLTTVINIIVFQVCVEIAALPMVLGNTAAWVISVLFAFVTNKKYVFEAGSGNAFRQMIQFYMARVATLAIETVILYLLLDVMGIESLVSKIISNIVVIILNYVFSKLFVFKH